MTKISTDVQWQSVVNCQNGVVLLVLAPELERYEEFKLYQWEMCMQLSAQGASINMPEAKSGNKVKHLLLKLEEIHSKNMFTLYSKKEKRVQVALFPKTASKVNQLLTYDVKDRRNKNISFLFHVMSMVLFYTFKNKIFSWLLQNQINIAKIIFRNTKETVQCLGHLTNINLLRIDPAGCQELVNDLTIGAATEKSQNNANFLRNLT
eukprot:10861815-Ditylum_brightwellii.AAC.1